MTKKILLIIGILVIVGIVAFLIFSSKPPLAPGESRIGFSIRDYLPFGNSGNETTSTTTNTSTNNNDTGSQTSTNMEGQLVPKLRKISKEPIAGAVIFNTGTTSLVRFIEKGTGNVYEARSDSVTIQRLTNTTIPKIIRAFWLPNASGFLAQTLSPDNEIIETNFVKLNKNVASSTNEILTPFNAIIGKLPTGIKEIAIKPDSTKIFYYTIFASSNWYISNPDGTSSSLVASNSLTEWLPKWISPKQIIMQNKGSFESIGYSYSFDVSNKTLKKIGLGMIGLSVNPKTDGSWSLASSGGASPELFMIDNKNVISKDTTVKGLAEKCVWLKDKNPSVYCAIPNKIPGDNYPDIWYKGLVSTEDSIWKMDVGNIFGEISNLPLESGEKIDVVDLSLSPDETHLIFKNKIDGYLWMLRIDK